MMSESKTLIELAKKFNIVVFSLLDRVEKKSRCEDDIANLDIVRRRITQYKRMMGDDALLKRAAPIIIDYAEPIIQCQDKFFTEMDIRAEVIAKGGSVDADDEYIFSLIESVKKHYKTVKDDEKKQIFADVNTMLECSSQWFIESM